MDEYTSHELAYQNGYAEGHEKGYKEGFLRGFDAGKQDAMKWIPVTERWPEMPGTYLVTGRSFRNKTPQIWICECILVGSVIGWCNDAKNPVIEAWMPLPEPPKGE